MTAVKALNTEPAAPRDSLPPVVPLKSLPAEALRAHNKAARLFKKGQFAAATKVYAKLLGKTAGDIAAIKGLGNCLYKLGRHAEAIDAYERALEYDKGDPAVYLTLGNIANALDMPDKAIRCFEVATQVYPSDVGPYNNLAGALRSEGRYEEAIEVLRAALKLAPESAALWNTLGTTCYESGDLDNALTFYDEALRLNPKFAEAYNNIGLAHLSEGRYGEALEPFEKAIKLAPKNAQIHFSLADALEKTGDYERAWEELEWRLDRSMPTAAVYNHNFPLWKGQDIADKALLICAEQGVGDQIMYASMFREAIEKTRLCLLECDFRLISLFHRSFPTALPVPIQANERDGKQHRRYPVLSKEPPVSHAIVAGSLLRYFRPDLESFRGRSPYLVPDPERVEFWRRRLDGLGPGLKVGICWRSKAMTAVRVKFYTEITQWGPVFAVPGVHFINLQYDECADELAQAKDSLGVTVHDWDDTNLLDDFEAVAAMMANLDLVISAPTAVVQLAGAVGAKTWLIGNFQGPAEDPGRYKWYDGARLFTRDGGKTRDDQLELIGRELAALASGGGSGS